jgi:hypothetical protein
MARQVQLRRGTTAEHSTFTGAVGEVTVDTDKDVVVVHDGSTAGGFPLLKPADLTAGTGITISGTTITNAAPDQTVVLTGGTGISTSGTYPSFTITNDAPDQTVVLTEGSNVTITGTYPNFTIASTDTNTTYTAGTGLDLTGTTFSIDTNTVVSKTAPTGSAIVPAGTTDQRDGSPAAGFLRYNSDEASFEGYNGTEWGAIGGGGGAVPKLFAKDDAEEVAWTKTAAGTAETQTALYVEVNGSVLTIASGTSITMPTFASGTDYAIWCKPDGTLEATSNHTSPPVANARKIGGFHYAPGGNATAQSGGNTTPQINEYSFWDLNFRPSCPDPRGMTLVGGGFWADIYLTGVDAITNGSSKFNVTMADGSSPPKVPTMFGGDGSTTYGGYTWFEAQELATAFGKRTLTQLEFMSAAYGTTEASSVGTDQVSTVLNAAYTSKWGVIQAAGVLFVWGRDRGGPFAASSWNANTEGRGSEFAAPNAVLFGGSWNLGSNSGSRCSYWYFAASYSAAGIGSRFACDHLQLG